MSEKTLESLLDCKEIQPVNHKRKSVLNIHCKDWCWSWNSNTLATWCKELTHWKRPWWKERLKAGGERDNRGWDSWMASPTWQTWVWASSESWWWTGKPGMLQSYGVAKSQTLLRDWTYSYISSHWVIHFKSVQFFLNQPILLLTNTYPYIMVRT